MATKKEEKLIERTYNVPLRKEFRKVPRWKKTNKAVSALRQFLSKHMKSENVKLGKELNEKMWKDGRKNPPHHVKVNVTKDSEGIVRAELFGIKKEVPKKEEKKGKKAEGKEVKKEAETEEKPKVEEKKETPKTEEKKEVKVEEKKE
jgi:large subunit ribosomal protein L31e